jgi:Ca2+-binding EF-hand superfamily protein
MRIRPILAVAAISTLPALLLADEQTAEPSSARAEALLRQLDSNADGLVAAEEVSDEQRALFDRLVRTADKNGDQKLDQQELAAGLALDEPRKPRPPRSNDDAGPLERLRRMDANSDGKIALDELPEAMQPFMEPILDQFDEDGDDALSLDEMRRAMPVLRERFERFRQRRGGLVGSPPAGESSLLKALDANHDGALDSSEINEASTALKRLDANGDGTVSAEELRFGGNPPGKTPDKSASARPSLAARLARFQAADKDGDGRISKDEAPDRLRDRFDRIDRNGDGFIDKSEIEDRISKAAAKKQTSAKNAKKKALRSATKTDL